MRPSGNWTFLSIRDGRDSILLTFPGTIINAWELQRKVIFAPVARVIDSYSIWINQYHLYYTGRCSYYQNGKEETIAGRLKSRMDKIIKITMGLFVIILIGFVAMIGYGNYVETSYRNSLMSSYTYTFSITTDSPLTNLTFFIPVPVDRTGNSPMVTQYSAQDMQGVPSDWRTALFDTGKATLLKITAPSIKPSEGTTPSHPYTITLSSQTDSKKPVDSQKPSEKSVMFRPVQDLSGAVCPPDNTIQGVTPQCFTFLTSIYADYRAAPSATVSFRSTLVGRNNWTIFEPQSNEYRSGFSGTIHGENHGWVTVNGTLTSGIGIFDVPVRV